MKHKHYEMIVAWAAGEDVQYFCTGLIQNGSITRLRREYEQHQRTA